MTTTTTHIKLLGSAYTACGRPIHPGLHNVEGRTDHHWVQSGTLEVNCSECLTEWHHVKESSNG